MIGAVRFGAHVFDPRTGLLWRGREARALQAQPAQLLALLVERHGEIVSRDQIRERLWPDTVVCYDQNINFAIRHIRAALGADKALVQTVPRSGYRFIGDVSPVEHQGVHPIVRYAAVAAAIVVALASGFGAGVIARSGPMGQFVYDHLVHPDRCPYLRPFIPTHRNS